MEEKWRCTQCGAVLGLQRGHRLHVRHKEAQYVIEGAEYLVTALCRRCSTLNERREGAKAA